MKKLLIILIITGFISGCEKTGNKINNPEFLKVIPGGCAVEQNGQRKSLNMMQHDTVTYSKSPDKLEIMVGFNATCCGEYNCSSIMKNDTLLINIVTSRTGMCNCICYYTYTFIYAGSFVTFPYIIKVDDYLTFKGLIR